MDARLLRNKLNDAIRLKQEIVLDYADESGRKSLRWIHPLEWKTDNLLLAVCLARRDIRAFRLDRILSLRTTNRHFEATVYVKETKPKVKSR